MVKLRKYLYRIDQLSFVIFVKNSNYSIDQYKFSSYTTALMANTKSAIKRIRRIAKQTLVNKARKEQDTEML